MLHVSPERNIIPYALIESLRVVDNIYEARLFAWLLIKAQSVLKYYDKELGHINMQYALDNIKVTLPARLLLQQGDDNYKHITKAFELANKAIDYKSESGAWYKLNIIAFPAYFKQDGQSYVSFYIHNQLWYAILDNFRRGYRNIDLLDILHLTSRYSVIIYMLTSQQENYTVSVERLRQLTGASGSYMKYSNFKNRIIDNSIKDIEAHTSSRITYDIARARGKKGNPTDTLTFHYTKGDKPSNGATEAHNQAHILQSSLSDEVKQELTRIYGIAPAKYERYEAALSAMGTAAEQLRFIDKVAQSMRKKRAANPAGYLYNALKKKKGCAG